MQQPQKHILSQYCTDGQCYSPEKGYQEEKNAFYNIDADTLQLWKASQLILMIEF
jgi:hypothetical protein